MVFWDGRRELRDTGPGARSQWKHVESRHIQQIQLRVAPAQLSYHPDGKSILYCSTTRQLGILNYGKQGDSPKELWYEQTDVKVSDIIFIYSYPHPTH